MYFLMSFILSLRCPEWEGEEGQDDKMKVVLGPVPLGYSPLPPPYPSLRPQSSLNLHLTEGIVHEGFNQLWS